MKYMFIIKKQVTQYFLFSLMSLEYGLVSLNLLVFLLDVMLFLLLVVIIFQRLLGQFPLSITAHLSLMVVEIMLLQS